MIDWKTFAIDDLRKYTAQKRSLKSIPERIEILREEQYKIKGSTLSAVPTHGGSSKHEDKMLSCIVLIDRLEKKIPDIERKVALVDMGLSGLDSIELLVLDRFYINPIKKGADKLMEELGYEKSKVYELRNQALYNYTITQFGSIEL
ncbi:MAG: hypothetical protein AB9835_07520 [Eubacteriales bacterium]